MFGFKGILFHFIVLENSSHHVSHVRGLVLSLLFHLRPSIGKIRLFAVQT